MQQILTANERIVANTLYQLTSELKKTNPIIVWGTEHGRATKANDNDPFVSASIGEITTHFPEHVVSLIQSLKEVTGLTCRYASICLDGDGYEVTVRG
jgi:hypothetical protein